ncbi:MAG: FAD-dependent oxidoreductase [Planctomycetes bacterium]|nr:FAD-dependent oxidoreductase [Planctomycetota bacterium]
MTTSDFDLDVLVFGGGIAGLWALDALRQAGFGALLVESSALGRGQTIQSQSIVHGGGKYALRGVGDMEAVRAIAGMPARWLACLEGRQQPDLHKARIVSKRCMLWLPKGGFFGDLAAKGMMSIVVGAGLLATKPEEMPEAEWPEGLKGSAIKVYSMAEPVIDTGSVLEAFRVRQDGHLRLAKKVEFRGAEVILDGAVVRPGAIVFAAGAGNEDLLRAIGDPPGRMQRRPLTMVMLRGHLPELWAHCVVGGKTHLTITTVRDSSGRAVWQVGGEIAERGANATDLAAFRADAAAEIRRFLPGLKMDGMAIATYPAVRAEAATSGARRPSGVHVEKVRDNPPTLVAWPTKLALAPVLADELVAHVSALTLPTGRFAPPPSSGPAPAVSKPPWEEATWFPVP